MALRQNSTMFLIHGTCPTHIRGTLSLIADFSFFFQFILLFYLWLYLAMKGRIKMKINAKVKNKRAVVKVMLFGQEIDQFGITSDDDRITSDVISDYINTRIGDDETREVADEIMRCLGRKVAGILIEDFDDNGKLQFQMPEDWIQQQNNNASEMGDFLADKGFVDGMTIITNCTKAALLREIKNIG